MTEPVTVRLTAADRPGVAQPVPVRDIPPQPWGPIFLAALALATALLGAWEWRWREYGAEAGYYANSAGLWAMQRRRIDQGEGDATVIAGASRMLFDVQLPVWERLAGRRPIQLALEGTSPMAVLEGLADDPQFTGRLIVGVAPDVFFSGYEYRGSVFEYLHEETPAQRAGQWLSMRLFEPFVASYDPDFALRNLLKEDVPWPDRPGKPAGMGVRKLSNTEADRNTHMWRQIEVNPVLREHARAVWAQDFAEPAPTGGKLVEFNRTLEQVLHRAEVAVARLRARGVPVVFVRAPSGGEYLKYEQRMFPRASTWDVLLKRTGAPGIHFEDYPEMQGFNLPEWSHLARADAERYTAVLYPVVERLAPAGSRPR